MRFLHAGFVLSCLSIALATVLVGCGGGGPELAQVSGAVTHAGQPVPNLMVTFVPEQGRPSTAITDPQGHYNLQFTQDRPGVLLGKHRVYFEYAPPTMDAQFEPVPQAVQQITAKYGAENSPLAYDIQGDQEINLQLD